MLRVTSFGDWHWPLLKIIKKKGLLNAFLFLREITHQQLGFTVKEKSVSSDIFFQLKCFLANTHGPEFIASNELLEASFNHLFWPSLTDKVSVNFI